MKSALEIAMERFKQEGEAEPVKLTPEQKAKLKDVDRFIDSKIAEKKMIFEQRIPEARASGDPAKVEQVSQELATELSRLQAERETKKDKIRQGQD